MAVVLVLPTLEALAVLVLGADVVDDGPMTVCGTVIIGGTINVDWTIGVDTVEPPGSVTEVGALWDDVDEAPSLVSIVIDGTPPTSEHTFSNESMIICASETTLIVGSSATAQLTQPCTLAAMVVVQRQLGVVQESSVVPTD